MKRRLRVLHVLPSIQGYGAERQVVELLKRLPSSEIEAGLLTIYEPHPDAVGALNFPVAHAGRKNRADRFFIARLIHEIRRLRPDIVHTHTHVGKYWGRFAAAAAGVPSIVHTEHNPCDFRRKPGERAADRILHRATSKVVTFFQEQALSLCEFEGLPLEKVAVIPNGLSLPEYHDADRAAGRRALGARADQFTIMIVGRMEFQKNQALALRAVAAMRADLRQSVAVYFAGSGEDESALRGAARACGLDDRVRFLGYRTDVPRLLPGADLVLMTSWFEGMPLALIEAMIAGVPIVSTPWIGARNMLAEGRLGYLAADYDEREIAAQIEHALTDPIARRELAERAAQHARERYGIERMVDAHRSLYVRLAAAA